MAKHEPKWCKKCGQVTPRYARGRCIPCNNRAVHARGNLGPRFCKACNAVTDRTREGACKLCIKRQVQTRYTNRDFFCPTCQAVTRHNSSGACLQCIKRQYRTITGRAAYLLRNAKTRAGKRGVPCTLTLDWFITRLEAGVCEITGLPFTMDSTNVDKSLSPSTDRIELGLGYTPENSRLVLNCINSFKGTLPEATFKLIAIQLAKSLTTGGTTS